MLGAAMTSLACFALAILAAAAVLRLSKRKDEAWTSISSAKGTTSRR